MRNVPASVDHQLRNFLETQAQPKTVCVEQDLDSAETPDLRDFEDGGLVAVIAKNNSRVFLKVLDQIIELQVV